MRTLMHFRDFVKEISSNNSKKFKQSVLEKYKDDYIIEKYLKIAFDPYVIYGISTKKLQKEVTEKAKYIPTDVFDLFEYLKKNNTGRDRDIAVCYHVLDEIYSWDTEAAELLRKLICKDLVIGCDAKIINSVLPMCIPTFNVQLANKYFDKPEKLSGKTFSITTKLDGFRLIAMKDEHGNVSFFSRVGKRIEGLVEIEEEMKNAFASGIVFDGELTVSNYFEMESKEAYKAASKIISQKGETPKTGLTFRVFDILTYSEWRYQICKHTYTERRNLLEGIFGYAAAPIPHIELLPVLYWGSDTSEVTKWLDKVVSEGGEGVMINLQDSTYKFTRCWDIMKVKKFNSLDLEVVGMEEGSGRLAGTLGAIHVRYKGGNTVKVGSGFSDEERKLYWEHPEYILSKIVEIKFFEESSSGEGVNKTYSLRFPTWCSNIRDPRDKATPDF